MITKVVKFLIAIFWIPLVVSQFVPGPQYCPETGGTICERVDNYPEEHIYQLVSRTKREEFNNFTSLFVDEPPVDYERIRKLLYEGSNQVQERQQSTSSIKHENLIPACYTSVTYIPPKAALNDKYEWKYIVNVQKRDSQVQQHFRVELCVNKDEKCVSHIHLPHGFTNKCEQRYIKRKMLAVDTDGKGASIDNFFLPSCCVCNLYRPKWEQ